MRNFYLLQLSVVALVGVCACVVELPLQFSVKQIEQSFLTDSPSVTLEVTLIQRDFRMLPWDYVHKKVPDPQVIKLSSSTKEIRLIKFLKSKASKIQA